MLASRYENNHQTPYPLNEGQQRARNEVAAKVKSGHYAFETISCCICDGSNFEPLSDKDRYGLFLPVVICRQCGLIQTNPRMNQSAYNEFYDKEYRRLYSDTEKPLDAFFREQVSHGRRIEKYLSKTMGPQGPGALVVEIGCGAGGILKHFRDKGWRILGCDLGTEYLNYGRHTYQLDLQSGFLADLKMPSPPDLIIYSHVLEHILDVNKELQTLYHILQEGAKVYIEIPSVKNIHANYQSDFLRLLQNAHTYHFTLATLTSLMEKNGFKFLSGNEKVEAVFVKANPNSLSPCNDYQDVMQYLKVTERQRKWVFLSPVTWLKKAKRLVGVLLEFLGLKETIQKLLGL